MLKGLTNWKYLKLASHYELSHSLLFALWTPKPSTSEPSTPKPPFEHRLWHISPFEHRPSIIPLNPPLLSSLPRRERLSFRSALRELSRREIVSPFFPSWTATSELCYTWAWIRESLCSLCDGWSDESDGSGAGWVGATEADTDGRLRFLYDDIIFRLDVLYAAAGPVSRLKMNDEASGFGFQNKGLHGGLPPPIVADNALSS